MAPSDETYFYSCNECTRFFLTKNKLKLHQKTHQTNQLLDLVNQKLPLVLLRDIATRICKECPICGEDIRQDLYTDHIKSHGVNELLKVESKQILQECRVQVPQGKTKLKNVQLIKNQKNQKKQVSKRLKCRRVERRERRVGVSSSHHQQTLLNTWGMHKCLQCGIIFIKEASLRLHQSKRHTNKSPYGCRVCGKKFLSKIRLESHQTSHTVIEMPELEYNNGVDYNNSSSESQPPELNPEGEYSKTSNETAEDGDEYETCLTCGDAIAGSDILPHITTHLQPGQTECLHCDFEASQLKDLLDHMTVHYGLKTYVCTFQHCGKAYHWKHSLARHMVNAHSIVKAYQCLSCGESFATVREERRHALTHVTEGESIGGTGNNLNLSNGGNGNGKLDLQDLDLKKKERFRPYKCEHCDKRFMKKKQVRAHEGIHLRVVTDGSSKPNFIAVRRIHQPVNVKPRRKKNNESSSVVLDTEKRACKTCGEEMLLSELLVHIKTHVTKDQRQCELCQHVYANVESLREHMHTHYGLEPHQCTICHKTYSLKQSVLNHIIRNHKAVKPLEFYACTIPSAPKPIKEPTITPPKKPKNGKLNSNFLSPSTPATPVASTPSTPHRPGTPVILGSQFAGAVQQQLQVHATSSPLTNRSVTPSTSNTNSLENGSAKKSQKPINFQCNFCNRVFTTKFSVQRHEAKLHNFVETDGRRVYKTTYATAEDSSDAVDSHSMDMDHSWGVDGKLGSLPDITFSYNNGNMNEMKHESLRSEIRSLLFQQDHSMIHDASFKEIPASLY